MSNLGRRVLSYAAAALAVACVAGLRAALEPVLHETAPLILFMVPVAIAAWAGGFGPGLFATALGLVVGLSLFAAPLHAVTSQALASYLLVRAVPFSFSGVTVSLIAAQLEAAREREATAARQARAAEAAARRGEELQRRIFEGVHDFAIFTADLAGRVTTWNAAAERLFGYGEGEAVGMRAADLFTPADRAAGVPAAELARAAAGQRSADDRWHVRRDKSRFFASGTVTPIVDPDGTVVGYTKVARDVTEQHATRQALSDARRRADTAGLAGDVGTFEWDVVADRVWGDENFARLFGLGRAAAKDGLLPLAAYTDAIHPDDRHRTLGQIRGRRRHRPRIPLRVPPGRRRQRQRRRRRQRQRRRQWRPAVGAGPRAYGTGRRRAGRPLPRRRDRRDRPQAGRRRPRRRRGGRPRERGPLPRFVHPHGRGLLHHRGAVRPPGPADRLPLRTGQPGLRRPDRHG